MISKEEFMKDVKLRKEKFEMQREHDTKILNLIDRLENEGKTDEIISKLEKEIENYK